MSRPRSNRSTEQPLRAKAHADITPLMPPPTTATLIAVISRTFGALVGRVFSAPHLCRSRLRFQNQRSNLLDPSWPEGWGHHRVRRGELSAIGGLSKTTLTGPR